MALGIASPDKLARQQQEKFMIKSLAWTAALSAWFMVTTAAATEASAQDLVGAPGGRPFEARCDAGEIMIGVATRAGAMIDAIAPICAMAFNSVQIDPRSKRTYPQYFGGPGGQAVDLACPTDYPVVVGIYVSLERDGRVPDGLALECKLNTNSSLKRVSGDDYSGIKAAEREQIEPDGVSQFYYSPITRCPPRHVAVGIHGASSRWLNQLGVMCAYPVEHNPSMSKQIRQRSEGREYPSLGSSQILQGPRSISPEQKSDGMERRYPHNPSATNQSSKLGPVADALSVTSRLTEPEILPRLGQCHPGFVWREAGPDDRTCVMPEARDRVRNENDNAAGRTDPNSPYGARGCQVGYVWREAFPGDLACVSPQSRTAAAQENGAHHQNAR